MESNNSSPILEIQSVSKHFSGVYALKNIDMQIYPGEVTALLGENGAGKSTLMKIISGVYPSYEGEVTLNGETVHFQHPKEAAASGIVIIHQELSLIPYLTITENLFLGQEITNKLGLLDYKRMNRKAKELLLRLELDIDPTCAVSELRVGHQQLVEIARALLFNSRVLIMDEPTSAISNHEVELLFGIIKNLKKQGVAIVYISHKMKEVFELADRYVVLRDGQNVGSGRMKESTPDQLVKKMVGRQISASQKQTMVATNQEVLRVENLSLRLTTSAKFLVQDVSFRLMKGEVLGISGLMGAGRTELLEAIFGLHPGCTTGQVWVEGKALKMDSVNHAISAGISLVPEDRKKQGLILQMNVAQNTSLANLKQVSRVGFLRKKAEDELGEAYTKKLSTKVPDKHMEVQKLSGGNQQKVVIAKWLATHPKIILLDEPTRGIDIGAKTEIYSLIHELALQGMGVVVVSSELPEILAVSDRIMVLSNSKQTGMFLRADVTEENLLNAALQEID